MLQPRPTTVKTGIIPGKMRLGQGPVSAGGRVEIMVGMPVQAVIVFASVLTGMINVNIGNMVRQLVHQLKPGTI